MSKPGRGHPEGPRSTVGRRLLGIGRRAPSRRCSGARGRAELASLVVTLGAPGSPTRRRDHLWQFGRFALVGASGVAANLAVLVVVKRLGPHPEVPVLALPPTAFHIRWYHLYSTVAFLVANLWNFQLNRSWTFRSSRHAAWWSEYWPFLAIGFLGQFVGLLLLTLLMHRGSPLALPARILDDSSGLRTRLYWAQLIVIAVVTPMAFALNKVWTFAAVRTPRPSVT